MPCKTRVEETSKATEEKKERKRGREGSRLIGPDVYHNRATFSAVSFYYNNNNSSNKNEEVERIFKNKKKILKRKWQPVVSGVEVEVCSM